MSLHKDDQDELNGTAREGSSVEPVGLERELVDETAVYGLPLGITGSGAGYTGEGIAVGGQADAPVSAEEDGVRAFDQNGQQVIVPRQQWSTEILPGMLQEAWDNPDQLYGVILNSLNDRFVDEIVEAARRLYETDTIAARGACMWGIVLLQTGRLDEAEQVLEGFVKTHGEDGSVLVNLAKVYATRGQQERAEATLWRSLEVEPNLDNGLGWYASLAQERGGDQAAREALERVAQLPGSWRAFLWLARGGLGLGDLEGAIRLYGEALQRATRPVPADFLMQMSGDLGSAGRLHELIALTGPHFVPEMHGLPVGNNLIKAHVDTGNLGAADAIKNSLAAFNRPDWREALTYWDAEIRRRATGAPAGQGQAEQEQAGQGQVGQAQIQIGMLRVDGPVWLPPGSPARGIFGAKAAGGPTVTFLGGTAESPEEAGQTELRLTDALGRMTRALPLFLAEQTELRTGSQGRAMLPWAVAQAAGQPSGFVVSGAAWPDETAVQMVSDPANQSDYVVSVHVDAEVEPWTASLVFVRTRDGVRIGELDAEFASDHPEEGLPKLAEEVIDLLGAASGRTSGAVYEIPTGVAFADYLLRLEQLLAIRCSTMDGVPASFLNGERQVIEGNLGLCEAEPENVAARLLLIETMGAMERTRPEIAGEYRDRFGRLMEGSPLAAVNALFSRA